MVQADATIESNMETPESTAQANDTGTFHHVTAIWKPGSIAG